MKRAAAIGLTAFAALAVAAPAASAGGPPTAPGCQGLATAASHGAEPATECLTVTPGPPPAFEVAKLGKRLFLF